MQTSADVTGTYTQATRGRRDLLERMLVPALVALGAVLLVCSHFLPGLWRIVVLPALLLAPGFALLRMLGQVTDWHSVTIAVPVSIVLVICASLVLDVCGIRLSSTSLGLLLGAATALFLGASSLRYMVTGLPRARRAAPVDDQTHVHSEATVGD
jgi:hypothetical protein